MPKGALVIIENAPFFDFNSVWTIREVRRSPDGTWEVATFDGSYTTDRVAAMPYESALVALSFGKREDDWVDLHAFGRTHRNIQRWMHERKARTHGSAARG